MLIVLFSSIIAPKLRLKKLKITLNIKDICMNNLYPQNYIPFVYIVDSPSQSDDVYSIGKALKDVLTAIHIRVFYEPVFNITELKLALGEQLKNCIAQHQVSPSSNAYPFIHLCMHGNQEGVSLTDGTTIKWSVLR